MIFEFESESFAERFKAAQLKAFSEFFSGLILAITMVKIMCSSKVKKAKPGYAVLVEKAGHFLEKVGLVGKKPYFFSVGQVLVV
jgi:hypothetical protein